VIAGHKKIQQAYIKARDEDKVVETATNQLLRAMQKAVKKGKLTKETANAQLEAIARLDGSEPLQLE